MMLTRLIRRRPKRSVSTGELVGMPGFDRDFYLTRNPDVAESGTDPLGHYLEHGWREGREPSSGFTGQRYLALNPDVAASGINPLVHFLNHGLAEGRPGANAAADLANVVQPSANAPEPADGIARPPEPTRLI